jgi:hypothetical protein
MHSNDQELFYRGQVLEFFRKRIDPVEIGKSLGGLMVFGELIVTYPAYINALVLYDPQLVDKDAIPIEKIDTA